MTELKLQDLKSKSPTELLAFAEQHGVENASTMRKQELMFAVLKQLAGKEIEITGSEPTGIAAQEGVDPSVTRSVCARVIPGGSRRIA